MNTLINLKWSHLIQKLNKSQFKCKKLSLQKSKLCFIVNYCFIKDPHSRDFYNHTDKSDKLLKYTDTQILLNLNVFRTAKNKK